jgi:hypothetical protein
MARAAGPTADQPITRTVLFDARLRQVKDTDRVEIREIRILRKLSSPCSASSHPSSRGRDADSIDRDGG